MPSLPFRLADLFLPPAPDPRRVGWMGSVTYAHRGLHGAGVAENSPSAFAAAMEAGFGIECDIRKSRDGRAVVFHDATLERLAGRDDEVAKLGVGELTQVTLLEGGETIPTLRDLLDRVAGRVPLLLELKSEPGRSISALCRAVQRDLEGYRGPVAVMSFESRAGQWFAQKAPHVLCGLVISEHNSRTMSGAVKRLLAMRRSRAQFLAYDIRDLPSGFAARQRKRGLPVLTWTVSSPALLDRARKHADAPIAEGQGLA